MKYWVFIFLIGSAALSLSPLAFAFDTFPNNNPDGALTLSGATSISETTGECRDCTMWNPGPGSPDRRNLNTNTSTNTASGLQPQGNQ